MTTAVAQLVTASRSLDRPGRTRALARLMSTVENEPAALDELQQLHTSQRLRPAQVIGITGPPGAGKSTLVDALLSHVRVVEPERRLGVIAVDPSSPFTGGAVLGDRVRLMRHATDDQIWIRSLATRGHLGGLAQGVEGVLAVMALAGCHTVFIETVGVGQSEIEIARTADRTCVVFAPGLGDGIQALKAGLMEIGDLLVVNKADRDGAERLRRQLLVAVERRGQIANRLRHTPVLLARAAQHFGIDVIWQTLTQQLAESPQ